VAPASTALIERYEVEGFCPNCGEEHTIKAEQAVLSGEFQEEVAGTSPCDCGWVLVYKEDDPDAAPGTSSISGYDFE